MGSNSFSTNWSTAIRLARSVSTSGWSIRTMCTPADSSARVTALMARSPRSKPAGNWRRKIRMLVSNSPRSGGIGLWAIRVRHLGVDHTVDICTELVEINDRSSVRCHKEVVGRDEPAAPVDRRQLRDLPSVTGHRERLALLDGIHDVFRPHAQVPLADLVLKHDPTIARYGTACYIASQHFDHRALARNARLPGHKLRGSARLLAELAKREWQ